MSSVLLPDLAEGYARGLLVLHGRTGHPQHPAEFKALLERMKQTHRNLLAKPVSPTRENCSVQPAAEKTFGYPLAHANGVALHHERLLGIQDDHAIISDRDYRDHGR